MAITCTHITDGYQTTDVSTSIDATGYTTLIVGTGPCGAGAPNGMTYAGNALTSLASTTINNVDDTGRNWSYWYIASPTTGSNTFTIDFSSSADPNYWIIWGCTGLDNSDLLEASGSSRNVDPVAISLSQASAIDSLALLIGGARVWAGGGIKTAGSGYTEYVDSQGYNGDNNSGRYAEGRIYTDGAGSKTVDNGAVAGGWNANYGVLLNAASAVGPAGVKTWDGVTQSTGIKTYIGNTLANTKTVDGIA